MSEMSIDDNIRSWVISIFLSDFGVSKLPWVTLVGIPASPSHWPSTWSSIYSKEKTGTEQKPINPNDARAYDRDLFTIL